MNSNNSNINYFINGSKCNYRKTRVNDLSADTITKKSLVDWKQYQNKPIPEKIILKWIKLGLLDKGLAINSGLSYRGKNKANYFFSTTIEHLMTVTGSSSSTCPLSMSIANSIT
jgi:hypothetical protein